MSTSLQYRTQLLYALPIPGLARRLYRAGKPNHTVREMRALKYLIFQSMGRGSIPDRHLRLWLESICGEALTDLVMEECFLRLDRDAHFDPGRANEQLAKIAFGFLRLYPNLIIIAQWEIAYAIWDLYEDRLDENQRARTFYDDAHRIICLWPTQPNKLETREVMAQASAFINEIGLSRTEGAVISHPDMLARTTMILWRLGITARPIAARIPFVPNSVQKWARNWRRWGIYEALVHVHHLIHRSVSLSPPKT